MFLLETLDNKVAQALAITALSKFWHLNSAEDKVIPSFEDLAMKRNFGGVLFVVGRFPTKKKCCLKYFNLKLFFETLFY